MTNFALKALNLIFSSLIIGLAAIAIFRPSWVELFIEWTGRQINALGNWNYLIAFTSSIIETFPVIGVLVPGQQVMLLVGGFFGKTALWEVIVVAIIGAIIGNAIGYFLGKRYGNAFLEEY